MNSSKNSAGIIPIALFSYARPDHLKKTLEGLRANHVPLIYAFSDGPKTDDKKSLVNDVRELLHKVDWCSIQIVEREKNLGLGVSILTGVEQVFENHDKIVVIEDDIVLAEGAYQFICSALDFYEGEPRVMSVSLWCDPRLVPKKFKDPVFFCPRFNCWGWGTYKRSWEGMNIPAITLLSECRKRGINVDGFGKVSHMAIEEKERNIWAIRFLLQHLLKNGANVWPTVSLTMNIGFDGSCESRSMNNYNRIIDNNKISYVLNSQLPVFNKMNAAPKLFKKLFTTSSWRSVAYKYKKIILDKFYKR